MVLTARSAIDVLRCKPVEQPSTHQFMQLKRDGWMALYRDDQCWSGNMKPLPYILPSLPQGSLLAGEIYVEGGDSHSVPTAIANKGEGLLFICFAVHSFAGELIQDFEHAADVCRAAGIAYAETLPVGPMTAPKGCDGIVYKHNQWPKWFGDWGKKKAKATLDLRYVGWEYGKGRLRDTVGSIKCVTDNGRLSVSVSSGLSDELREAFKKIPKGVIVEIEYEKESVKGLRHPRFLRFREDKDSTND